MKRGLIIVLVVLIGVLIKQTLDQVKLPEENLRKNIPIVKKQAKKIIKPKKAIESLEENKANLEVEALIPTNNIVEEMDKIEIKKMKMKEAEDLKELEASRIEVKPFPTEFKQGEPEINPYDIPFPSN